MFVFNSHTETLYAKGNLHDLDYNLKNSNKSSWIAIMKMSFQYDFLDRT